MNKLFAAILIVVLFAACDSQAQNGSLNVAAFESAINTNTFQLLDVRTAGEYQSGHLKNALQADWNNQAQFIDRIKYLDKLKPLLVYCASGMRSGNAAKYLTANGFTNVQNLQGGLTAWKMEAKPVEAMTNTAQLSMETYMASTKSAPVVLVDFGAQWCPPCKTMEPVLQKLQAQPSLKFSLVKVDGGMDINVMQQMKVEALPVFIIYKKGIEVWRNQGVVDFAELKKQLSN